MLQQLSNILVLACMYSLVAIGFSLYFGTIRLINFAHGDLCTLAAFLFILVLGSFHLEAITILYFIVIALIAIIAVSTINYITQKLLFKPVKNRPPVEGLIISIALSMLIREAILHFFPDGANPKAFPDPFNQMYIEFRGVRIQEIQFLLMGVSILLFTGFYFFISKSHLGRTLRASSQDPEAALMIGIPVNRNIAIAFIIGGIFATVAGIMNGAIYGSIKYDMGYSIGIKGFAAATIGGLDRPFGALLGGFIIAMLEVIVIVAFPDGSSYKDIVAYALLLLVLLIRPSGLLSIMNRRA